MHHAQYLFLFKYLYPYYKLSNQYTPFSQTYPYSSSHFFPFHPLCLSRTHPSSFPGSSSSFQSWNLYSVPSAQLQPLLLQVMLQSWGVFVKPIHALLILSLILKAKNKICYQTHCIDNLKIR